MELEAPFPYFGGKSQVAGLVWPRFGHPENYKEPFFGTGAVLLGRPRSGGFEVANDLCGFITNFWRATQRDPGAVAEFAAQPVHEADLHARHLWLGRNRRFTERLREDPDWFDARIAGWWVWGQSLWIGHGWCRYYTQKKRPALNGKRGVTGRSEAELRRWFDKLKARLAHTVFLCGDWSRTVSESIGTGGGTTAIFLDPPYGPERDGRLYNQDAAEIAMAVEEWAIAHGSRKDYRIALCGLDGDYDLPGWRCMTWKPNGGHGNAANARGRENTARERIWFSPHCLEPEPELFA